MKLTVEGIKKHEEWEKAGIALPGYERKNRAGFILELEIFSVFLLAVLLMVFWKKVFWTKESPV